MSALAMVSAMAAASEKVGMLDPIWLKESLSASGTARASWAFDLSPKTTIWVDCGSGEGPRAALVALTTEE